MDQTVSPVKNPVLSRTGPLTVHARGFGFVKHPAEVLDVFVPPVLLAHRGLLADDVVAVEYEMSQGRATATTIALVERRRTRVFGVVRGELLLPDPRVSRDPIALVRPRPRQGTAVVAELLADGGARVIAQYGDPGSPPAVSAQVLELENLGVVAEYPAVLSCPFPEPWFPTREDLSTQCAITIDSVSPCERDDAVYAEDVGAGVIRLYVHITDVAAVVVPDSPVDRRAARLGATVYLPGRVVPMLADDISPRHCSFDPGVRRCAVSVSIDVDPTGRVRNRRVFLSHVQSDAALTFALADEVIRGQTAGLATPVVEVIRDVFVAAVRLERAATRIFPVTVEPRPAGPAERAIEVVNRYASHVVAEWLRRRRVPTVYRVGPWVSPNASRVVSGLFRDAGFDLHLPPTPTGTDLVVALEVARERGILPAVSAALRACIQPPYYGSLDECSAQPHQESYVRVTSPMRRYADLVVQRAIHVDLTHADLDPVDPVTVADLNAADQRVRRVTSTARRQLLAIRLRRTPNWNAMARVERVTTRGMYVRIDTEDVEGWVTMHTLGPSARLVDDVTVTVGPHRYVVGQSLRVRVAHVEPRTGTVEFRADDCARPHRSATP